MNEYQCHENDQNIIRQQKLSSVNISQENVNRILKEEERWVYSAF